MNKNPFSQSNTNRYQLEQKGPQPTLAQLQQQKQQQDMGASMLFGQNTGGSGPASAQSNASLGYQSGPLQQNVTGSSAFSIPSTQPIQPTMTGSSYGGGNPFGQGFGGQQQQQGQFGMQGGQPAGFGAPQQQQQQQQQNPFGVQNGGFGNQQQQNPFGQQQKQTQQSGNAPFF